MTKRAGFGFALGPCRPVWCVAFPSAGESVPPAPGFFAAFNQLLTTIYPNDLG